MSIHLQNMIQMYPIMSTRKLLMFTNTHIKESFEQESKRSHFYWRMIPSLRRDLSIHTVTQNLKKPHCSGEHRF